MAFYFKGDVTIAVSQMVAMKVKCSKEKKKIKYNALDLT